MYSFGDRSAASLATCDPKLIEVADKAILVSPYDFSVIEGHRSIERQQRLFKLVPPVTTIDGITKKSMHNYTPSKAFDLTPYPLDWHDFPRFYLLAGVILSVANSLEIKLIWGGDWDSDGEFTDQKLHDLPHFQLAE